MPRKLSYKNKLALKRIKPDFFYSSYEEDILEALEKEYTNPLAQSGLDKKTFLIVIGKAGFYFRKGLSRSKEKIKYLRDVIAKDMGISSAVTKSNILKVLFFLTVIGPKNYPVLNAYLSPKEITMADRAEALKIKAQGAGEAVRDKVQDVAKGTAHDFAKFAVDTISSVDSVLPWYLKTKVLIPVGIGGLILFYGMPFFKAKKKSSNLIR